MSAKKSVFQDKFSFGSVDGYEGMILLCCPHGHQPEGCLVLDGAVVPQTVCFTPEGKYSPFFVKFTELELILISLWQGAHNQKKIVLPKGGVIDTSNLQLESRGNLCKLVNDTHAVAQEADDFRRGELSGLTYDRPTSWGSPVDVIIEGTRVQDKAIKLVQPWKYYRVHLHRRSGIIMNKQQLTPYKTTDLDVLWVHIRESSKFYLVPRTELEQRGMVQGGAVPYRTSHVSFELKPSTRMGDWMNEWQLDYEDQDVESRVRERLHAHRRPDLLQATPIINPTPEIVAKPRPKRALPNGVYQSSTYRFRTFINDNGIRIDLGYYDTAAEASKVYQAVKRRRDAALTGE